MRKSRLTDSLRSETLSSPPVAEFGANPPTPLRAPSRLEGVGDSDSPHSMIMTPTDGSSTVLNHQPRHVKLDLEARCAAAAEPVDALPPAVVGTEADELPTDELRRGGASSDQPPNALLQRRYLHVEYGCPPRLRTKNIVSQLRPLYIADVTVATAGGPPPERGVEYSAGTLRESSGDCSISPPHTRIVDEPITSHKVLRPRLWSHNGDPIVMPSPEQLTQSSEGRRYGSLSPAERRQLSMALVPGAVAVSSLHRVTAPTDEGGAMHYTAIRRRMKNAQEDAARAAAAQAKEAEQRLKTLEDQMKKRLVADLRAGTVTATEKRRQRGLPTRTQDPGLLDLVGVSTGETPRGSFVAHPESFLGSLNTSPVNGHRTVAATTESKNVTFTVSNTVRASAGSGAAVGTAVTHRLIHARQLESLELEEERARLALWRAEASGHRTTLRDLFAEYHGTCTLLIDAIAEFHIAYNESYVPWCVSEEGATMTNTSVTRLGATDRSTPAASPSHSQSHATTTTHSVFHTFGLHGPEDSRIASIREALERLRDAHHRSSVVSGLTATWNGGFRERGQRTHRIANVISPKAATASRRMRASPQAYSPAGSTAFGPRVASMMFPSAPPLLPSTKVDTKKNETTPSSASEEEEEGAEHGSCHADDENHAEGVGEPSPPLDLTRSLSTFTAFDESPRERPSGVVSRTESVKHRRRFLRDAAKGRARVALDRAYINVLRCITVQIDALFT